MDKSKYKIYIAIAVAVLIIATLVAVLLLQNSNNRGSGYDKNVQAVIDSPLEKIENSSTLLSSDEYIVTYQKGLGQDQFLITVNANPVPEVSLKAEQAFLKKLNITQEYACTLPIILGVPSMIDENLAGYSFNMSFCPDGIHISDVLSQQNGSNKEN